MIDYSCWRYTNEIEVTEQKKYLRFILTLCERC